MTYRLMSLSRRALAVMPIAALALSVPISTLGQDAKQSTGLTRVQGSEDAAIPVPQISPSSTRKDVAAHQAIALFVKAVNGGQWTGIQATGAMTFPDTDRGQQSAVFLSLLKDSQSRLDIKAPEGERSIRIHGVSGEILESDGKRHTLPLAAAWNGIFAFPKVLSESFPNVGTSLIDRGMVLIEGRPLHRVTIQEPFAAKGNAYQPYFIGMLDLYFDPSTSLLVKSAASVQLDPKDRARYLQVVTYGDYRKVGDLLIPYRYVQTLNGQRQWSLELTDAHVEPSFSPSYFHF